VVGSCELGNEPSGSIKSGTFFEQLSVRSVTFSRTAPLSSLPSY
jgi:hypothetical protein